jgi:hypothetical protein
MIPELRRAWNSSDLRAVIEGGGVTERRRWTERRRGGSPLHDFQRFGVGHSSDQILDDRRADSALRHQLHDGGDRVAPASRSE